MKTRKWGKTFLAVLLAAMMILPSVAAMADPDPNEGGVWVEDGTAYAWDAEAEDWVEIENKLDGDLQPENAVLFETALDIYAEEKDSSFEVTGSVVAEIKEGADVTVKAIAIEADTEKTATAEVGGDVTAALTSEGDYADAYGILVDSFDEGRSGNLGTVNVHVAGDVTANAEATEVYNEEYDEYSAGAYANGIYASTMAGDGEETAVTNITVDGKVSAKAEIKETEKEGERNTFTSEVAVRATTGAGAETNITIGKGAEGQVYLESHDGGKTSLTIQEGGVTVDAPVNHELTAAVDAQNDGGTIDVDVKGDITAENQSSAINAFAKGEHSETTLTIDGNVSVTNDEWGTTAVNLAVSEEALITATITGDTIEAVYEKKEDMEKEDEAENETRAVGIVVDNIGGDLAVEVTADVKASGADNNIGVLVVAEPDYKNHEPEYVIDEDADPVQIDDEEISLYGYPETIQIGDEEVEVFWYKEDYYKKTEEGYLPVYDIAEYTYNKGKTDLTITGDVTADIGMYVDVPEVQTANITVDGTITGETAGIVLQGDTQLGDNLTMTVWEVKPAEDNVVVLREKYSVEKDEMVLTEDKEAEKLIQYIIKIEDNSKDYIATVGTADFTAGNGEKYQVAHEGDKVLVKLNIPEGKELVGAYWDKAQSEACRLLKDAEGNYYLEVPWGGGVMLSVTLKDAPKPEPEPQPVPIPVPDPAPKRYSVAEPIVTVRDLSGMVTISFYASRNYVVTLEDGSKERGTFEQIGGEIFLQSGDREITIANDGAFTYICQIDVNRTYHFVLSQTDLDALLAVK